MSIGHDLVQAPQSLHFSESPATLSIARWLGGGLMVRAHAQITPREVQIQTLAPAYTHTT